MTVNRKKKHGSGIAYFNIYIVRATTWEE